MISSSKRNIEKVIVLGSGSSIKELSKHEVEYINKCKTVIAINKFAAFYKLSGIIPTHIYFHDFFGLEMFKFLVSRLKNKEFNNLKIYTNKYFRNYFYSNNIQLLTNIFRDLFLRLYSLLILIFFRFKNSKVQERIVLFRNFAYEKVDSHITFVPIDVTNSINNFYWAKNIKEKIFHFRGSLSSVLNLVTILFPNRDVFLVGNDFNGSKYFFQNELEELGDFWKDFTTPMVKNEGSHYSFQKIEGRTIESAFPFIISEMKKTKNKLFCINEDSLLVRKNLVNFKRLI